MMKKTTRFFVALGAMLTLGTASFAQTRSTNLQPVLNLPGNGTTITSGVATPFKVSIKNNGPDNLIVGDTLFFVAEVGNAQILAYPVTATVPMGQTIVAFDDSITLTISQTTPLTADLCVKVYNPKTEILTRNNGQDTVRVNYNDADTSNNRNCNEITVKPAGPVGIFDLTDVAQEQLTLYPNPADKDAKFNIILDKAENVVISVRDITGREVMRKDFGRVPANNTAPFSLNFAQLNAGMYIVELNAGARKAVGKITVQH
jgi:hypothetical protein